MCVGGISTWKCARKLLTDFLKADEYIEYICYYQKHIDILQTYLRTTALKENV